MSSQQEIIRPSHPQKFFERLLIFLSLLLFLYSFTQVDLGLTLTRASIFATIQHAFQYIGFFNRPLSTFLLTILIIGFTTTYFMYLLFIKRQPVSKAHLWRTIFIVSGVLALSYTAFSYDIFNYIFDAKIITFYHQNPYLHKALDFPGDPMLSFMHWTHRTYPYGPFWLGISLPFSYIGLQFFLPTYFLFKGLALMGYLLTVYSISRILQMVSPKHETLGIAFFALNPLVLIESLVSGHNDIAMMGVGMFGFHLFLKKKYFLSFIILIFSAGIKFATGFIIPLFALLYVFRRKNTQFSWESIFFSLLIAMIASFGAMMIRSGQFQPWYLLVILPFASLLSRHRYVLIPFFIISFGALLNYLPYFYSGNWDDPIPSILLQINSITLLMACISGVVFYLRDKKIDTR
ncbi:MAG: hypothetical protein HZC02_04340 [Candidatus Levybacteria bacterium]|nr:hypothetical protein [Candidatus Levybacteria bacterium]